MVDWGRNVENSSNSRLSQDSWMGGVFDTVSGATLDAHYIFWSDHSAGLQVRVGVYQGGNLDDPDGVTNNLIEDLGSTAGTSNGWVSVASSTNPALSSGANTWVGYTSADNNAGQAGKIQSSSAGAGDFQTARGQHRYASWSGGPSVALPATYPSGGSFEGSWWSFYITYTAGGGGGGWTTGLIANVDHTNINKVCGVAETNISKIINVASTIIDIGRNIITGRPLRCRKKVWGGGLPMKTNSFYEFWARKTMFNMKFRTQQKLSKFTNLLPKIVRKEKVHIGVSN